MKNIYIIIACLISMGCTKSGLIESNSKITEFTHQLISQPVRIVTENAEFVGTENLLNVPENRNDPNSRMLALHFFRFPAKQKSALAPVMFLGAGPGEPYAKEHFFESEHGSRAKSWVWELAFVNQQRDLILINQRGNPQAPGLVLKDFKFRWKNGSKDTPFDWPQRNKNRAQSLKDYMNKMDASEVDVRGYTIIEMLEDIESIRRVYGDEKLALIGTSFGSQWALAYLRQYPQHVDRAILAGVEPLDRNHDKPSDRWQVLKKIADYAAANPELAPHLPKGGLLYAYKSIIKRFENGPIEVELNVPGEKPDETMILGLDDFRMGNRNPYAKGKLESINSWPQYITEIYNGDLRLLALRSRGRGGHSGNLALAALVDKSIGVSKTRALELEQDQASRWLGPINGYLNEFSKFTPNLDVGDLFRQQQHTDVPVIMIQGDMDLQTPIENAMYLQGYLTQNHLVTVKRGTHTAKRALILGDPKFANDIYQFMNLDFEQTSFQDFKATLPDLYELPAFKFWPIGGESLFDKYTK